MKDFRAVRKFHQLFADRLKMWSRCPDPVFKRLETWKLLKSALNQLDFQPQDTLLLNNGPASRLQVASGDLALAPTCAHGYMPCPSGL